MLGASSVHLCSTMWSEKMEASRNSSWPEAEQHWPVIVTIFRMSLNQTHLYNFYNEFEKKKLMANENREHVLCYDRGTLIVYTTIFCVSTLFMDTTQHSTDDMRYLCTSLAHSLHCHLIHEWLWMWYSIVRKVKNMSITYTQIYDIHGIGIYYLAVNI